LKDKKKENISCPMNTRKYHMEIVLKNKWRLKCSKKGETRKETDRLVFGLGDREKGWHSREIRIET
jgi:hypothetical protein